MSENAALPEALLAATMEHNMAEVKRIIAEIEAQQEPRTFADAWNYEGKTPKPQPGSFAEVWGYARQSNA